MKEGVLPPIAVIQAVKGKVSLVQDFQELNDYMTCHTGSDMIDVYEETKRK